MKFICESVPQGLRIPTAALNLSHIPYGGKVELHTLDCALVLLKGQVATAMTCGMCLSSCWTSSVMQGAVWASWKNT